MRNRFCRWILVTAGAALGVCGPTFAQEPASPAARRSALLAAADRGDAAIPTLRAGLADPHVVVRRTAARLLVERGVAARAALQEAFGNDDPVVRQTAMKALVAAGPAERDEVLPQAVADPDSVVRLMAVQALAAIWPRSALHDQLLAQAAKDGEDSIRAVASRALWPFRRDVIPLRQRPDWDHEVAVVATIPLPRAGWRFHLDPKREGHLDGWFKPTYDQADWAQIEIEQPWQKAGYDYIGVAWYRLDLDLPAAPEGTVNAVELAFGGVDECAWVWVNGTYVGQHDIGPAGWDKPFTLDITDAVAWGKPNQITVRAMNTAHAGGIWRPVQIEVLR